MVMDMMVLFQEREWIETLVIREKRCVEGSSSSSSCMHACVISFSLFVGICPFVRVAPVEGYIE